MRTRLLIPAAVLFVVVGAALGAARVAAAPTPTGAVVMSGLDNPRGLTFARVEDDDDGHSGWALYVAEAGKGGTSRCALVRGETQCVGATGAVSRYWRGQQRRVVTGLPSYANSQGTGATGPHDVSFFDGKGYVTIGLGGPLTPTATRALVGNEFGWIVRFTPSGRWSLDTDVASYEEQRNPDGGPADSNPYGLLAGAGRGIVVDAGGNSVLRASSPRRISTLAVIPARAQGRSTDAVPNSVARGRDGAYYVGELTGAPFVPGTANVWRVVPGQTPQVYCSGFSFILDLDFDRRGNLYVLEHTSAPFPLGPGTLYRVERDCSRVAVVTGLTSPTSVAIGPDGGAYISHRGTSAAIGEVLRFDIGAPPGNDDDGDDNEEEEEGHG
jgi:hypothetical protein